MADLTPGTVFGGYRIERLLGRGGMGAVYAAEQLDDGRQVAVKVLTSGLGSEEDRERFFREGRTAASINHPNTVYVYRTEEIDGLPTITMELVDGGTLEEKVARRGPLPIDEAIRDTLQIIDGLEAAQRHGILHRDIKPANCFVGPGGEVKVGDFGLSRPVDQVDHARLTQTGLFLGTPVFSSPEQLMGETLDLRSDMYAVGATLYYLLSGKLPFNADNAVRLIAVVMSGAPTPLVQQRAEVSEALNVAVMQCLERKRDERFADYGALRAALESCLPMEAVPAPLVRRFAAQVIDAWIIGALASMLIPVIQPADFNFANFALDPRYQLLQALCALPIELVWYALIEGLTGWSPGKRLLGLRVARLTGGPPGVARGAVRGILIAAPGLIAAATGLAIANTTPRTYTTMAITWLGLIALFVRARKSNGFVGEHDRITGTRVLRKRVSTARHRSATTVEHALPAATESVSRVGPYEVSGTLASTADVLLGNDGALRRAVWIVRKPAASLPLSDHERQAVRAGCARWIGGRRAPDEAWDAYAATSGVALRTRLSQPYEWRELHAWLSDLVDEMLARDEHGDAASVASNTHAMDAVLEHVLVTDEGRAMILPFPLDAGGGTNSGGGNDSPSLLRDIARLVSAGGAHGSTAATWPLRAHAVLAQMASTTPDLRTLKSSLADASERTEAMTPRRRATLWSATVAPLVFVSGFMWFIFNLVTPTDVDARRIQPLVSYLSDKKTSADSLAPQRRLVAVYLAGHLRERIVHQRSVTDTVANTTTFISKREWKLADSIVVNLPQVDPLELQQADRLVEITWNGIPPGEVRIGVLLPLFSSLGIVMFAAFMSIAAALIARRGLLLRVLGLELVRRPGEPSGRLRMAWRQILVWAPIPVAAVTLLLILTHRSTPLVIALCVVSVAMLVVGLISAWRNPSRGLVERLSGTTMVPE